MKRVNSEYLVFQVIQADKDQRGLRDSKGSPEPMERREPGEPLGNLAQEDREARPDRVESEGPGDPLERLDPRETLEVMDLQDLWERGVSLDLKDQLDSQDQRAPLAQLERTAFPVTLGREERLVSKARPAPQAPPAWLAPRARQVRPDQWEIVAIPDPQAHLVSRVCPDQLAKKEQRGIQVPPAPLVKTVLRVSEGSPETEGYPVPWVLMA